MCGTTSSSGASIISASAGRRFIEIALAISMNLRPALAGTDEGKLKRRYTDKPEAYQLYLKGRYFWLKFTPEDHKKAAEYFNQAIAIDPTFALAYSGLGDTYGASATNGW